MGKSDSVHLQFLKVIDVKLKTIIRKKGEWFFGRINSRRGQIVLGKQTGRKSCDADLPTDNGSRFCGGLQLVVLLPQGYTLR